MEADIVCLQEMHASSHSTILSWLRHSGFRVASSSLSNQRCGVAILVNDVYNFTQVRKDDDGRFLQVEIDIEGHKLRFVSLCAKHFLFEPA
jgi:exonuclease III